MIIFHYHTPSGAYNTAFKAFTSEQKDQHFKIDVEFQWHPLFN